MSRRAQDRREQREANRRCATASDLERLDRHYRKLPDDYSAIVRAKERARKGGYELTEAQLDKLRRKVINTTWEDAQTIWACLRRSREFRKWTRQLAAHPGEESRVPPEILIVAMTLAADDKGRVHRTTVCQVINGMESRIWFAAGMCDNKTREPVSFNTVWRQLERFEELPEINQPHPDNPTEELTL